MRSVQRWLMLGLLSIPMIVEPFSLNPISWLGGSSPQKAPNYFASCSAFLRKSALAATIQAVQRSCTQELKHLVHYTKQHPVPVFMGSCLVAALIFMRSVKKHEQRLQQAEAWSTWKRDAIPLPKRNQYDAPFADELLHAIQMRYMNLSDITDFMGPIRSFMADVEDEVQALHSYVRSARLLQQLGLRTSIDMQLYRESNERIERLELLKCVCLQWLSQAKLASAV